MLGRAALVSGWLLLASAAGAAPPAGKLVLVGGRVYPSPTAPPIGDGVVVVEAGKIVAVGPRAQVPRPPGAVVLDCTGGAVVAGLWNSHVHFTEPKWEEAAALPAQRLGEQLRQMLTSHGFTTVVDTGSHLSNTLTIRKRISAGEVAGPRIFTAGVGLYPPDGVPYYLKDKLPAEVIRQLPQPATARDAERLVNQELDEGSDIVKLFVVSWIERGQTKTMPLEVVLAATAAAHRRGKLVFAHPSIGRGVELVLQGHVDVLAHTIEEPEAWTPALITRLKRAGVSLIPTLKLFGDIKGIHDFPGISREAKSYADAGGQILFGTDVGYLTDYDPTREYQFLAQAGLTFPQILASLTTAPASRMGAGSGAVAPGGAADLVVVEGDPARDARAFAAVRFTIREGQVIYRGPRAAAEASAR
jgi:imidazolonepropionase-like amidohydrolase